MVNNFKNKANSRALEVYARVPLPSLMEKRRLALNRPARLTSPTIRQLASQRTSWRKSPSLRRTKCSCWAWWKATDLILKNLQKWLINTKVRCTNCDRGNGVCLQVISSLFIPKYAPEYIFNLRIRIYPSHIKYRCSVWGTQTVEPSIALSNIDSIHFNNSTFIYYHCENILSTMLHSFPSLFVIFFLIVFKQYSVLLISGAVLLRYLLLVNFLVCFFFPFDLWLLYWML
jgi:hypothetical protein